MASKRFVVVAAVLTAAMIVPLLAYFVWFLSQGGAYLALQPGDTRQEVLYRLGYPESVLASPESVIIDGEVGFWSSRVYFTNRNRDPINALPSDKRIHDFPAWQYEPRSGRAKVTVTFRENRLSSVACGAPNSGPADTCPSVFGIAIGSTEEQVIGALGSPVSHRYSGPSKTLRYSDLGVEFVLSEGRTYLVVVNQRSAPWSDLVGRFLKFLMPDTIERLTE